MRCNPQTLFPWLQPGAPVGACMVQALGTCPQYLELGKKYQQPQFRCTPIDPRCPIFQHLLPQNWVSLLLRAKSPLRWTGPDLTHVVWPRPCILHLGNQVQPLHCLPSLNSYTTRNESWAWRCCHVQAIELAAPQVGCSPVAMPLHSPSLETLARKRPRTTCS